VNFEGGLRNERRGRKDSFKEGGGPPALCFNSNRAVNYFLPPGGKVTAKETECENDHAVKKKIRATLARCPYRPYSPAGRGRGKNVLLPQVARGLHLPEGEKRRVAQRQYKPLPRRTNTFFDLS